MTLRIYVRIFGEERFFGVFSKALWGFVGELYIERKLANNYI